MQEAHGVEPPWSHNQLLDQFHAELTRDDGFLELLRSSDGFGPIRSPRNLSDRIAPLAQILRGSVATDAQPTVAILPADESLAFQACFITPHCGILRQSWFVLVLDLKNGARSPRTASFSRVLTDAFVGACQPRPQTRARRPLSSRRCLAKTRYPQPRRSQRAPSCSTPRCPPPSTLD